MPLNPQLVDSGAASIGRGRADLFINVIDFAEDQEIYSKFDCRSGISQTYMHELLEGAVNPPYPGRVLLCCAKPRTDTVIDVGPVVGTFQKKN